MEENKNKPKVKNYHFKENARGCIGFILIFGTFFLCLLIFALMFPRASIIDSGIYTFISFLIVARIFGKSK